MAFYLQFDTLALTTSESYDNLGTGAEHSLGHITIRFKSNAGNGWHKVPAGSHHVSQITGVNQQYGTCEFYTGGKFVGVKTASGQRTFSYGFSGIRFVGGDND